MSYKLKNRDIKKVINDLENAIEQLRGLTIEKKHYLLIRKKIKKIKKHLDSIYLVGNL